MAGSIEVLWSSAGQLATQSLRVREGCEMVTSLFWGWKAYRSRYAGEVGRREEQELKVWFCVCAREASWCSCLIKRTIFLHSSGHETDGGRNICIWKSIWPSTLPSPGGWAQRSLCPCEQKWMHVSSLEVTQRLLNFTINTTMPGSLLVGNRK